MGLLSALFGGRGTDSAASVRAFAIDLGGAVPDGAGPMDILDALHAQGCLAVVDWADDAEMVLENLGPLRDGLTDDQTARIVETGDTAGLQGRGHAALPTLCAMDEALTGSGARLLWVQTGGHSYDTARVTDAMWAKWQDVELGAGLQSLTVAMRNEHPGKRKLAQAPQ